MPSGIVTSLAEPTVGCSVEECGLAVGALVGYNSGKYSVRRQIIGAKNKGTSNG